jgi:uncharacterized membrane protein
LVPVNVTDDGAKAVTVEGETVVIVGPAGGVFGSKPSIAVTFVPVGSRYCAIVVSAQN